MMPLTKVILSVLSNDYMTYNQIADKINNPVQKYSRMVNVGLISKHIWLNADNIQDKILWEVQVFGQKGWQNRMVFKIKSDN